ncbi:hypothetical protein FPO82_14745 (plasmid) [Staphylococcus aureus]|nr:hypothetical protein FPO82_14745 [Staphylococcus aureus]
MPYIYLIIAISTEVIGSAFLKSSEGFSKIYTILRNNNFIWNLFLFFK